MSDALRALAEQAERIHSEYRRHFAGRARFTRELSRLDGILEDTQRAMAQAEGLPGADLELLPVLRQRAELYAGERQAIAAVQAGGPDEAVAHRTGEWSRLLSHRYNRNFAGRNRLTRDLGLLQSMLADQQRWRDELRAVAARHDAGWHREELERMDRNVQLFQGEAARITQARQAQPELRQAQLLASAANNQFDAWRLHFQGRSRRGRRPALLRRMIASLQRILGQMETLRDGGVREDFHLANIDKVGRRLVGWQEELRQIEAVRASSNADAIGAALGEEANAWFSEYRQKFSGRPRSQTDIEGLARICEGLFEVGLAMEDQHLTWGAELNARNLLIVLENLKGYERELERVQEAQRAGA